MSNSLSYLNSLADSIGAAKFGIYVTQTLIGDSLMVSRMSRDYIVMLNLGIDLSRVCCLESKLESSGISWSLTRR